MTLSSNWQHRDKETRRPIIRDYDEQPLRCPACDSMRLRVIESRAHKGTVRRRRQCKPCGFRFFTMEVLCDKNNNPLET